MDKRVQRAVRVTVLALACASCDGDISGSRNAPGVAADGGARVDASTPARMNDAQESDAAVSSSSGRGGQSSAGVSGNTSGAGSEAQGGKSGNRSGAAAEAVSGKGGGMADVGGAGAGGMAGGKAAEPSPGASYTVTGSWPTRPIAIAQRPGKLVFTKIKLDDRFLSESCSISDYNRDGVPDISAGRRWYEGPFSASGAAKEHIFRAGHDELPRTGKSLDELDTGVADDWACYAQDVDADGYTDIINIACPDMNDDKTPNAATRQHAGTAFWYKNPGKNVASTTAMWKAYPMHNDVRGEQHGLADLNGDGRPEISGACHGCGNGDDTKVTRGYYQMDTTKPTAQWTYHAVTPPYEWPGGGWLHGFGFGDVNLDGKVDFIERAGVWTNALSAKVDTSAYYNVRLYGDGDDPKAGGSHMFATDVDGDGDIDIISADAAHGYGLSWYEQTAPGNFTKHKFAGSPQEDFPISFSEPHAMEVVDMDGDGVSDVIVGKTHLAHPEGLDNPDPDLWGEPVNYVFKVKRNTPSEAGSVTFEPHPLDTSMDKVGVGRQIAVGHIDTDGIMDVCIASKLGIYVFLGQ